MPASLSEAFGPDYSTYPANNNTQKKKKNGKHSNYGHQIPTKKYLSHEPKQEINIGIDGYNGNIDDINSDDQFLKINGSEYGPTDYNIKPTGIDEYALQMQNINMSKDAPINRNITGRIISAPINNNVFKNNETNRADVDVNLINEEDFEDSTTMIKTKENKQTQFDPRIKEFNDKLDLILNKLGNFDEPSQENIHDIILFVIFGCFVIFILDSIYRVGKMTF
jgi:hypothetical protein